MKAIRSFTSIALSLSILFLLFTSCATSTNGPMADVSSTQDEEVSENEIVTSLESDDADIGLNHFSVTFPTSTDGKDDNNAAVYEIQPFTLDFDLPQGWSLDEHQDGLEHSMMPAYTLVGLSNESGKMIGAIGYNIYDEYEGAEDDPRTIYNQIALGNDYHFDVRDAYEIVNEVPSGATALTTVYYSASVNDGVEKENHGIVSYNREYQVYIAIELSQEDTTVEQARLVAQSIILSR